MTQLCLILDAQLENENSSVEVLECYFLEALYSSLGATLLESDRAKFDEFIKRLSGLTTVFDEKELAGPGEIPGTITSANNNGVIHKSLFCFVYHSLILFLSTGNSGKLFLKFEHCTL